MSTEGMVAHTWRTRSLTLALCIALAACGGGPAPDSADARPADAAPLADAHPANPDEFGAQVRAARCARFVRCGRVEDLATCFALLGPDPLAGIGGSVANGAVEFDQAQAQACLDALTSQSCGAHEAPPAACLDALTGTRADAAECFSDAECISGSCLLPACGVACCAGTCNATPPPGAAEGAACGPRCAAGLYCSNGSTHVCTAPGTAGAPCEGDYQCVAGLVCGDATCRAPAVEGAPCFQTPLGPSCGALGLVCNAGACVPMRHTGASCSDNVEICDVNLLCDPTTRTCDAPDVGEPCSQFCRPGAYCVFPPTGTPTCAAVQPNGATCASFDQCASGYCNDSKRCADVPACF